MDVNPVMARRGLPGGKRRLILILAIPAYICRWWEQSHCTEPRRVRPAGVRMLLPISSSAPSSTAPLPSPPPHGHPTATPPYPTPTPPPWPPHLLPHFSLSLSVSCLFPPPSPPISPYLPPSPSLPHLPFSLFPSLPLSPPPPRLFLTRMTFLDWLRCLLSGQT